MRQRNCSQDPDPEDELRAAAKVMRERAATATSPHWWIRIACRGPTGTRFDAEWIVLVNPGLAEPLAGWLDSAAVEAEQIGPNHHAIAVARFMLGCANELDPEGQR